MYELSSVSWGGLRPDVTSADTCWCRDDGSGVKTARSQPPSPSLCSRSCHHLFRGGTLFLFFTSNRSTPVLPEHLAHQTVDNGDPEEIFFPSGCTKRQNVIQTPDCSSSGRLLLLLSSIQNRQRRRRRTRTIKPFSSTV